MEPLPQSHNGFEGHIACGLDNSNKLPQVLEFQGHIQSITF